MAEPLTPEREAIVRQRQPGDWLPDAWLIRDVETVDGTVWQVLHRDTVLATLPDWAGNLALWIAEVHEDVPELLATIDRLRSDRGALRAEVLNEAADAVVAENDRMLWATKPGSHWAADLLRRLAAPPAPPVPDSTTGDDELARHGELMCADARIAELTAELAKVKDRAEFHRQNAYKQGALGARRLERARRAELQCDHLAAELDELKRPSIEARRNEIRSTYTALISQAEQDRDHEGAATLALQLRESEAKWAAEDTAGESR